MRLGFVYLTRGSPVLDLRNTGKEVNADKAYPSAQRRAMLKALGFQDGIQRKANAKPPLSECQERRNHRIVKRRARVEHVFAGSRHMGGKFVRKIVQVRQRCDDDDGCLLQLEAPGLVP